MKTPACFAACAAIAWLLVSSTALADTILYSENFQPPVAEGVTSDQNISLIHWAGDIQGANQWRLFTNNLGITVPEWAIWSWATSGAEAYFTNRTMNSDFSAISLATGPLKFSIDMVSDHFGANTLNYFAVQIDDGQWYVSTVNLGIPPATFTTFEMAFNAARENWRLMTVNAGGSGGPVIGALAGADLAGTITGVGFVVDRTGDGTTDFRNFVVSVPEPPALGLGAIAAAISVSVILLRRRRQSTAPEAISSSNLPR